MLQLLVGLLLSAQPLDGRGSKNICCIHLEIFQSPDAVVRPPSKLTKKAHLLKKQVNTEDVDSAAVTRIRTGVAATTTQSTNHYTITASGRLRSERRGDEEVRTVDGCVG